MHCQRKEEVQKMTEKLYGMDQIYPCDFVQILTRIYTRKYYIVFRFGNFSGYHKKLRNDTDQEFFFQSVDLRDRTIAAIAES